MQKVIEQLVMHNRIVLIVLTVSDNSDYNFECVHVLCISDQFNIVVQVNPVRQLHCRELYDPF